VRPITAVLFDFAGTLLVPELREDWVAAVLPSLSGAAVADLARRLDDAGRPGGPEPLVVPDEWAADYPHRDLSTAAHRAVYEGLLSAVTDFETARRLYDRAVSAAGFVPYPDALAVLSSLRDRGVPVAVVSNVGFDLRAVFAGHGLASYVSAFVLSTEVGVMKPGAAMFQAACSALGVDAADALMVGDNFRADGGAVELGMRTLLLPYTDAGVVHGLDAVLRLVD
jgi:HAD superfamily hydrolase (TIGR01509 family)